MSQKPLSQIPVLSKGLHATRNLPEELEVKPVELISASFVFINTSKPDLFEPPTFTAQRFSKLHRYLFPQRYSSSARKFSVPPVGGENRQEKDRAHLHIQRNTYLVWLTSHLHACLKLSYSFNKIYLQQINIISMFQIKSLEKKSKSWHWNGQNYPVISFLGLSHLSYSEHKKCCCEARQTGKLLEMEPCFFSVVSAKAVHLDGWNRP